MVHNYPQEMETFTSSEAGIDAFSKMVRNLKLQAHEAIFTSGYPERGEKIDSVGEKLKEIFASEYAYLVTSDTFNSEEFLVDFLDYPLQGGKAIRRITYMLNNTKNDIPYKESRFFLQCIGEATFFSKIEYLSSYEKSFRVFENKEGIFAFSIYSYSKYSTYASTKELADYYANICYIDNNSFSDMQFVDIHLITDSKEDIKLVQEGEIIKLVVYDDSNERPEGLPELLFNSANLSFELPKLGDVESEPVDYDLPGLLLGLSDQEGNLRTLFIRKEDGKIRIKEYSSQIIFPRQNRLFSLKSYILEEELNEDMFGEKADYVTGKLDFRKILYAPLGVDLSADFEEMLLPKSRFGYHSSTDIPLYIGSDYVCYIQEGHYSMGGTYHWGPSAVRFDKLDDLLKFTLNSGDFDDIHVLSPNFTETTLADLVYGPKAKDLYQSDVRTYGGEIIPYLDFRQLSIKRNLGKWSLMLPLIEEYYHPGNGSNGSQIKNFAVYSNDVPDFLTSNSEAMELIGNWNSWNAKDILAFPQSNAFLAQYDYYIGIGYQEDGFWQPFDISIPVRIDEYIVSINFADTKMQDAWMNELSKVE